LTVTTNPLLIGKSAFLTDLLHGSLDDLRIYNRALSASEVAELFAAAGPLTIAGQPQGQTVLAGGNATFSVTASGAAPLTYQWQYNEANLADGGRISGATTATLSISNVETNDAGNYRVVVSNPTGSTTSQVAVLTVLAEPPANIEDLLMPGAVVLARGNLSGATVNLPAVLSDPDLGAQQILGYAVWRKPLSAFDSHPTLPQLVADPFPATVQLTFALSATGEFCIGAEGPLPDALAVVGTFLWLNNWNGLYDGFSGPTNYRRDCGVPGLDLGVIEPDNGVYEPKDIGLVGTGYIEFVRQQSRGAIAGLKTSDSDFRNAGSISVKHKFSKPLWVVYYPIFVMRGDEFQDWGVGLPLNEKWCQFASIFDNGTATRAMELTYQGGTASYLYCAAVNNNSEQSWIGVNNVERIHQYNWGHVVRKYYDEYPQSVQLGAVKTWSLISPAVSLTTVADTVTVANWSENPSLGLRHNPKPDVLELPPGVWAGNELLISQQPQSQTVPAGGNVTFSVALSGAGPLSYQWQFNGVDLTDGGRISGATTASLTIASVEMSDAGSYEVEVSNAFGSVTSAGVQLSLVQGVPPPAGLLGWWAGDGNTDDLAGNHPAVLRGDAGFGPGLVDQAFALDGTDAFVEVPDDPALDLGTNDFTVGLWVNFNTVAGEQVLIEKCVEFGNGGREGWTFCKLSDQRVGFGTSGGVPSEVISEALSLPTGTWLYFVARRQGLVTTTFLNGAPMATRTLGALYDVDTTASLKIGHRGNPADTPGSQQWLNLWLNGQADEVTLFNRALSDEEIAAIYAAGGAGMIKTPVAPVIVDQPQPQTVAAGADATFAVTATGTGPLSYQWQYNPNGQSTNQSTNTMLSLWVDLVDGDRISGATTDTLTISSVEEGDAGQYQVVVSNPVGTVVSDPAALTVTTSSLDVGLMAHYPLDGNANDESGNGNNGTVLGATPTTDRFGNPNGAYQFGTDQYIQLPVSGNQKPMSLAVWFKTGDSVDGEQAIVDNDVWGHGGHSIFMGFWPQNAQNRHLQIQTHDWYLDSGVVAEPNTWYHVVGVWSDTAAIYVNSQKMAEVPYLVTTLDATDYRIGRHNDAAPYWFLGAVDDVCIYSRALTDAEVTQLASDRPLGILQQPQSQTVLGGTNVSFSVAATGTEPLNYQWQYTSAGQSNWVDLADGLRISGATTDTLMISTVETNDAGSYRAVVTNPSGSVTSEVAVLTVITAPEPGLVAHYPLNGNANDESGNGNDGTVLGATSTTDRFGLPNGAYQFGVNQYIQLPVSGNQKPMSLAVWFKTGDSVDGEQAILSDDIPNQGGHSILIGFWYPVGHVELEVHNWANNWSLDSGVVLQPNTWYHVVGIWSDKVMVYVNGEKQAEIDYPVTLLDGTNYRIGRHNDWYPSWFFGAVDDVRLYSRALTDAEVTQLASDRPLGILQQPQSQTVLGGTTVSFSVMAGGAAPLSYQWQYNPDGQSTNQSTNMLFWADLADGGRISGATTATLTISSVETNDAGSYRVVVSSSEGSETSSNASLTVRVPIIWTGPAMTFTKSDWADWTQEPNQDHLTENVWLTRADSQGLFNIRTESGWGDGSPAGTEWAFLGLNGNPTDPQTLTAANFTNLVFTGFYDALEGRVGANIVGRPGVLHLLEEDAYLDVQFSSWTSGGNGGGFSYVSATPVTEPLAPVITTEPVSQTRSAGRSASFRVAAGGTAPLSYQWQYAAAGQSDWVDLADGDRITGASTTGWTTKATLTISNLRADDAGNYRVVVSNSEGSVTSSPVTLTVRLTPLVWTGPEMTFTKEDWADWTQEANQDRLIADVWLTRADAQGLFNSRIESGWGDGSPAGTEWAFLGLNGNPTDPQAVTAVNFPNLVFASFYDSLEQAVGANIVGRLGVLHLLEEDIYLDIQFGAWTSGSGAGGGGFSYTRATPVTEPLAPVITTQPISQTRLVGRNASFTFAAGGTAPLSYQWQYAAAGQSDWVDLVDGGRITGATNAGWTTRSTLTISDLQVEDTGNYRVVVTNSEGSVTSAPVTLTVCLTPLVWTGPVMTFTKEDWADWTLEANQDRLVSDVWLTRADSQGLFNIRTEVGWNSGDSDFSPAGTEWAFLGLNGNPTDPQAISGANYENLVFASFYGALEGAVGANIVGRPAVLHLLEEEVCIDIQFGSWTEGGQGGGFSYRRATPVTEPLEPVITTQPVSQTVLAGRNVSFRVAAYGTAPLIYQWQYAGTGQPDWVDLADGGRITGATTTGWTTTATLTISNVQADDAGNYRVVVSNSEGSVTSAPVTLTVRLAPVVWTGPAMTFTKDDWADWTQEASQDHLTPNVWLTRADSQGLFNIRTESVWDYGVSPAGTEWAFLGMSGNPTDPQDLAAANYQNLVFAVFADALEGAVGANIVGRPGVLHLLDEGVYLDIQFTSWTSGGNGGGFSYTRATPGTEPLAPLITTQPVSQTVPAGTSVSFSVTASGTEPLSYRWWYARSGTDTNWWDLADGGRISGATTDTLTIAGVQSSDTGVYTVVVANAAGTATSDFATLAVTAMPQIDLLDPASAAAGSPGVMVMVQGSGFALDAVVRWNGAPRSTTFVNASELTADIPASDLAISAALGSAVITVANPADGTVSGPAAFAIVGPEVTGHESQAVAPGGTVTVSTAPTVEGAAGVTASLDNSAGAEPAAVTAATYSQDPTQGGVFDVGGGFVDVQVTGATPGTSLEAHFYYPTSVTSATEDNVILLYFDGANWVPARSTGNTDPAKDTTDNLDATVSGGRFTAIFDGTSTPTITQLTGTVFAISVLDHTPPVPDIPALPTLTDECSVTVATIPTATDNLAGTVVATTTNPLTYTAQGTYTITWRYDDGYGNVAEQTQTVVVQDTTPPQISCPTIVPVPCSVDSSVPVTFTVTATDNCDPLPGVTCSPPSGSLFSVGNTTVTCTAGDASGNTSTRTFTVTRAALGFTGFLPPIGGADATGGTFAEPVRTFKLNSTIPVKFTAACGSVPVLTGTHTLQAVKWSSETNSDAPIDATPTDAATTGSQFRLVNGEWHFNLDTKATAMSSGKWQLVATLSDGSQHRVWIQVK
jgi:hypothetical protein